MAGSQNIGESSDNPVAVNVVAMVDVIFCLCIFFMCSFHFKQLEGKIDSWLPKDRGIFGGAAQTLVKDEIRVIMRWDDKSDTTLRKVRSTKDTWAQSDEELMQEVLELAAGYRNAGNTTWPLVIDAQFDVPWQEVIHVMDLCKRNGIERIEFAAPEAPIERTERPT